MPSPPRARGLLARLRPDSARLAGDCANWFVQVASHQEGILAKVVSERISPAGQLTPVALRSSATTTCGDTMSDRKPGAPGLAARSGGWSASSSRLKRNAEICSTTDSGTNLATGIPSPAMLSVAG